MSAHAITRRALLRTTLADGTVREAAPRLSVHLMDGVLDTIRSHAAEAAREGVEGGGILLGPRRMFSPITIAVAGDSGPRADRTAGSFFGDQDHALRLMRQWPALGEIGHWHGHPPFEQRETSNDMREGLQAALRDTLPHDLASAWVRDFDTENVYFSAGGYIYSAPYTVTDGPIEIGDPVKVRPVTEYVKTERARAKAAAERDAELSDGDLVAAGKFRAHAGATTWVEIVATADAAHGWDLPALTAWVIAPDAPGGSELIVQRARIAHGPALASDLDLLGPLARVRRGTARAEAARLREEIAGIRVQLDVRGRDRAFAAYCREQIRDREARIARLEPAAAAAAEQPRSAGRTAPSSADVAEALRRRNADDIADRLTRSRIERRG